MLYVKSLSIDRFKSFKHTNILFTKGFNCIVGPNGSGKSNICDALLFALGEGSLHRLRVSKLEYLIKASPGKKNSSLAKSHVRIELAGDENMVVTRGVRADGKTVFRLNDKRMTKQEVLEVLKKHHVHIDETSTVTQGEINKIIEANPKQKRELIDIAAGIKEFEYKKNEALSELEKVGVKISAAQAMLNERLVFLKELEKEKEAAENYLQMKKRQSSLNYSILGKRKKGVIATLDAYSNDIAKMEKLRKDSETKFADFESKIHLLGEERQKITDIISTSSNALGDTNKKLASIGNELSALEVKIATGKSTLEEAEKLVSALGEEIKQGEEKIKINEKEIGSLKSKIEALEVQAKKLGATSVVDDASAAKRIKEMGSAIQEFENETVKAQEAFAQLQSGKALITVQKESAQRELSKVTEAIEHESVLAAEPKGKAKSAVARREKAEEDAVSLQQRIEERRHELSSMDSEILKLKEHMAIATARDSSMLNKVRNAFGKNAGFYGTAAELCSYEDKYAEAIEAAAGSRFNYFVVQSMAVANEVIQYLKRQNLGRATFIPIEELSVENEHKEKGMQALTDLLKYDDDFDKVFSYIFSNTYLVQDIDEAKALGVGRRRYVTLSGETVERSGVLSGGSRSRAMSVAALERRLSELTTNKEKLSAEFDETGKLLFSARKESAAADLEVATAGTAIDEFNKRLKGYGEQKAEIEGQLAKIEKEAKKVGQEVEVAAKEHVLKTNELASMRKELQSKYDETLKDSIETAKKGMGKEEREKTDRMNKEIEEFKIKNAQMQQENKTMEDIIQGNAKGLKEKRELADKTRKTIASDTKTSAGLSKDKEHIEEEIKNSNKSSKEAFDRIAAINQELEALNKEQGSAGAKADEIARQVEEVKIKRAQTDVRLNDIVAELTAYGSVDVELLEEDVEKMEKEANVLSAKITALGNVNLKAPEAYGEKSRSVGEATEKVNTLETEKRAVLSMIEEIDSKKLNAFMLTFNEVNQNFSKLYNYIFPGKAWIELEDANNPLNGGLDVRIDDPQNFMGRNRALSGGQKSLISLMLLFAIHMCKPSAVYVFDEIDGSLDKENSKKLSQLIKQMAAQAQFIVVSHNDSLIVNADAALGVFKPEGESKVVGIEISSIGNK